MEPASRHLAALGAEPRRAGSAGVNAAREYCATVLGESGFAVTKDEFEYSEVAGGWATPVGGFAGALSAIGIYLGRWVPHLAVPSIALLVLTLGVLWYVGRNGVLDFPALRRTGVNLRAVRGTDEPTVWLVAHIDSKWQPVSMFARVSGLVAAVVGIAGLLFLLLIGRRVVEMIPAVLLLFTWLGCAALMLSIVGDKNHGTLDNASGVAAVLHAAESIPEGARVGVLITDAEELGLAGARAWARTNAPSIALNCDSVDDGGQLTAMYSTAPPKRLLLLLQRAAAESGEPLRVVALIPGILTDSVALASAGWETVTLARGNLRTLGRIHTSRDTLAFMRGSGIASAAQVLARTATELG